MADALVAPIVAGTMYVGTGVAAGVSINKINLEEDIKTLPLMGVMGAFVFATQMINFTIPGTGSSGHLSGAMLLSGIMGPYAGFITMTAILMIQALLFADGGILALGCNIWNMSFYGCFIGGLIIWKMIMNRGVTKKKIVAATIIGSIVALQLGAFSVVVETTVSGITELPFGIFAASMQPIHLAIGVVEGIITAAVLCFVFEARPELIWTGKCISKQTAKSKARFTKRKTIGIFIVAFILIAGILSSFASSNPDGLEWSVSNTAGSEELSSSGLVHAFFETVQGITSLLPDYGFKNSDTFMGTSFSGILGGIGVMGIFYLVYHYLSRNRKTINNE
jgi:cobalt/nickel transport system permease protein